MDFSQALQMQLFSSERRSLAFQQLLTTATNELAWSNLALISPRLKRQLYTAKNENSHMYCLDMGSHAFGMDMLESETPAIFGD